MTKTKLKMNRYKLIANGCVSFPRWELDTTAVTRNDAIRYATDVATTFAGNSMFTRLDVWDMDSTESYAVEGQNLIGSVYLRTDAKFVANE